MCILHIIAYLLCSYVWSFAFYFFHAVALCWWGCPGFVQVWKAAGGPKQDKFQYTYFAHKINSFETAPQALLPSDSRLRPDRYALELGDMSKAGTEKSRYIILWPLSIFLWFYLGDMELFLNLLSEI